MAGNYFAGLAPHVGRGNQLAGVRFVDTVIYGADKVFAIIEAITQYMFQHGLGRAAGGSGKPFQATLFGCAESENVHVLPRAMNVSSGMLSLVRRPSWPNLALVQITPTEIVNYFSRFMTLLLGDVIGPITHPATCVVVAIGGGMAMS